MQDKITYKSSGVDTERADNLVKNIKAHSKKTTRPEIISGIGGFNSLATIPEGYKQPVIVTCTDGVGTKLRLAIDNNVHTVGQDLVAMCVNDLIVCGAEPFLFLDYYATGELDPKQAEGVIASIADACLASGCTLAGGETAEMPGMYHNNDYDLAGFCVGVVEKSKIIDASSLKDGMSVIAIESSGCHSNGYSLVRKVLEKVEDYKNIKLGDKNLIDWLLEPTYLYVKPVQKLIKQNLLHAIVNITGGGLTDNIPRILADSLQVCIDTKSWEFNPLFAWLQQQANLSLAEMLQVFNCGIGMVVMVDEKDEQATIKSLAQDNLNAWVVGKVKNRTNNTDPQIIYT